MPSIAVPEATTAPTFKSAHFIGVGGAGRSGIALVLHERGCRVTGSDLTTSRYIRQLTRAGVPIHGVPIHVGHAASTIDEFQPDVVVVSTAIPETNPELVRARELGIPVWHRAKMLSALGYGRTTVACAGTHGKTAIPEPNPELVRARELGIPVWHRAKMLSALGYGRTTVACAGTPGKTTTSSMVATPRCSPRSATAARPSPAPAPPVRRPRPPWSPPGSTAWSATRAF